MGFEKAGIEFDVNKGVKVNKSLQTTNKQVYAAGDCCSDKQFTHNSDMQARTVLYNALLFSSIDATKIPLPRATYTDPEIATVGATE